MPNTHMSKQQDIGVLLAASLYNLQART